jgi:hypothetical protein
VAAGKSTAAAQWAWIVFEDESGQGLRPPKARTWAPRGQTPQVVIPGRRPGRISITGLVCYQPGHRARLFYRMHIYHGRRRERKGFTDRDYINALTATHHQLKAPIVVVWDNLNSHNTPAVREFIANHNWITVFQLPPYAPELNPTEMGLSQYEPRRACVAW